MTINRVDIIQAIYGTAAAFAAETGIPHRGEPFFAYDTNQLYFGDGTTALNVIVAIGGGVGGQPLDATLTALAALTIAADSLSIGTGADAFAQTTFAANTFPAKASTGGLVAKPITDSALAALAIAVGSAGGIVTNGGALGTPSSGVGTNLTGTATGLTAGVASAVALGGITGLGANVATALAIAVGSAGAPVTFNGALGTPSSGVATNLTGTAASLTAGTVTTNANLTGHVTSTGNAAILGSFTIAQLNTAVSDADLAVLAANTFTGAQVFQSTITNTISGNSTFVTGASAINIFAAASAAERVNITKDGTFSYLTCSNFQVNTAGGGFNWAAHGRTLGASGLILLSTDKLNFQSDTGFGAADAGIKRNAAAVIEANTGTAGVLAQFYGATLRTSQTTVAALPNAATVGVGARAYVTDANATHTAGIGTTVAGGGANAAPVVSNGTNWIIG